MIVTLCITLITRLPRDFLLICCDGSSTDCPSSGGTFFRGLLVIDSFVAMAASSNFGVSDMVITLNLKDIKTSGGIYNKSNPLRV